jgi:hypothetical protein
MTRKKATNITPKQPMRPGVMRTRHRAEIANLPVHIFHAVRQAQTQQWIARSRRATARASTPIVYPCHPQSYSRPQSQCHDLSPFHKSMGGCLPPQHIVHIRHIQWKTGPCGPRALYHPSGNQLQHHHWRGRKVGVSRVQGCWVPSHRHGRGVSAVVDPHSQKHSRMSPVAFHIESYPQHDDIVLHVHRLVVGRLLLCNNNVVF